MRNSLGVRGARVYVLFVFVRSFGLLTALAGAPFACLVTWVTWFVMPSFTRKPFCFTCYLCSLEVFGFTGVACLACAVFAALALLLPCVVPVRVRGTLY